VNAPARASRCAAKDVERLVEVEPQPLGQDPLCLLDRDPRLERPLEVRTLLEGRPGDGQHPTQSGPKVALVTERGHGQSVEAWVNLHRRPADNRGVTRVLGAVVLLLGLAVGAWFFALQSKNEGPSAPAVTQAEAQAVAAAASSNFAQVVQALQGAYAQTGTYVGAQLPAGSGVTLAQATSTSYCLETTLNGTLVHEDGPGGAPALGAC
jgi:hypothetical protein